MRIETKNGVMEVDPKHVDFDYWDFEYIAKHYFSDILEEIVNDEDEYDYHYEDLLNAVMKDVKRFYIELLKRGIVVDGAREVYMLFLDEYLQKAYKTGNEEYVKKLEKYLYELEGGYKFDGLFDLVGEIDSVLYENERKKAYVGITAGAAWFFTALFGTEQGRKLLSELAKILSGNST